MFQKKWKAVLHNFWDVLRKEEVTSAKNLIKL